jgi:hypothetical protein
MLFSIRPPTCEADNKISVKRVYVSGFHTRTNFGDTKHTSTFVYNKLCLCNKQAKDRLES